MSLLLYGHPFSSYTQKVLIALYENAIDFELGFLEPHTEHFAAWQQRCPLRKMPLLPADPLAALEVGWARPSGTE